MSYQKYKLYKSSGVNWLGNIPSHWHIDRLKRSIVSAKNGVWGEEPKQDENDIPCVRVADFDRQSIRVILDEPTIRNVVPSDRVGRVLERGDLLLEKSGGGENQPVGFVALYDDEKPAVCSNFVARVQIRNDMDSSYWRYVHAAAYAVRLNTKSIKQTSGIQNLDASQYFDESACFPPLNEQSGISDFLDHETAKIDDLSKAFEGLIETLKEKRQAVISHAVTKGLDPSVPMKDSGIEWLGQVPKHWDVCSLKRFCDVRDGTHDTPQFVDQSELSFPFITSKDLGNGKVCFDDTKHISEKDHRDFSRRSGVSRNDVLMPVIGSIGGAALVDSDIEFSIKNIALFKTSKNHNSRWLQLILDSDLSILQLDLNRSGGVQGFVGLGTLRNLTVPFPPIDDQNKIVDFLDIKVGEIELLIDECQKAASILQERRTALISAAVTGKIDVRGLVNINKEEKIKEAA